MTALATPVGAKEITESSKSKVPLVQTGSDDDATGSADFSSKAGKSTFRLKIKNGPVSESCRLIVGGVPRGTFQTSSKGSASLTLIGGSTLNFDPRGRVIEIEDSHDDKFLSNDAGGGLPAGAALDERVNLLPTGVQPLASGHATFRVKKGAGRFNVEIEDVTDGTYDVLVDGIVRGTITTAAGTGEIEFGDDDGGPALSFDPLGKLIQIALGSEIVLANTFLAGAPGVSVCTPAETTSELTPTALAPGGAGEARLRTKDDCERDFRVEIEDVPVGAYDLYVADILRGTIQVVVTNAGTEGEIEFSSEPDDSPSHELPLTFDPAGATIEIRQGTNVFFTATGGTTTNGACSVVEVEPDFTSTGLDGDAKGQARFRQDADCGRDFRVEVEKLDAGNYDLVVGGIVRGVLTVTGAGSETVGELEFDTEPTPGKLLLTFDPRGLLVEVRQGANVFLTVTMPE
jgi:hypothetical protein